jgi:hypothetical protein
MKKKQPSFQSGLTEALQNREIKRRTPVVSIFPTVELCERLIPAVLVEISEE